MTLQNVSALPRCSALRHPEGSHSVEPHFKLGRIMVIDDEEIDQMIYRRMLKRSGFFSDVVNFTSPRRALAYLKSHPNADVDLILLDTHMIGMTGFEFLEKVTAHFGLGFDIPVVVMLTVSLSPDDQECADSFACIKAYVNKPFSPDDIRIALNILGDQRAA